MQAVGRWARGTDGWVSTETVTDGSYHYFGSGGIIVARIDENGQPHIEAELAVPDWNVGRIALMGDHLVVLDYYLLDLGRAVRVIDISNPLKPSEVGAFSPSIFSRDLAAAKGIGLIATDRENLQKLHASISHREQALYRSRAT